MVYIKQLIYGVDKVNEMIRMLVGVMAIIMTVAILIQVLTRFIFSFSLPWTEEIARYLMIYTVFFGSSIALRNQDLISVEILVENIAENNRRVLKIIINIISIIFFIILMTKGFELVVKVHMQRSPALNIPMSIPYASVPIGSFLLLINSFVVIYEELFIKKGSGQR